MGTKVENQDPRRHLTSPRVLCKGTHGANLSKKALKLLEMNPAYEASNVSTDSEAESREPCGPRPRGGGEPLLSPLAQAPGPLPWTH